MHAAANDTKGHVQPESAVLETHIARGDRVMEEHRTALSTESMIGWDLFVLYEAAAGSCGGSCCSGLAPDPACGSMG